MKRRHIASSSGRIRPRSHTTEQMPGMARAYSVPSVRPVDQAQGEGAAVADLTGQTTSMGVTVTGLCLRAHRIYVHDADS